MPEKLWTDPEVVYATDLNTYLSKQTVNVCTSSTRPASPPEGRFNYETDTDKFTVWDGAFWQEVLQVGAWTSYTPTVTQNGAKSTSTNSFAYSRIGGKTVAFSGAITITQAGTAGNKITLSLPVAAASRLIASTPLGVALYNDGSAWRTGALVLDTASTAVIRLDNQINDYGISPSIATANGHKIFATATYEIA